VNISLRAVEMVKHHEGVRARAYRCPARLWTVGVGHVLYPAQGRLPLAERDAFTLDPIHMDIFTHEEIDGYLAQDLRRFESGVSRLCPAAAFKQGRFDALVSFSFNVGLGTLQRSTLRQRFNRGDIEGAADEFLKYTRGGGRVLKGLVNRRRDERALFLS
jgi:lysozyme